MNGLTLPKAINSTGKRGTLFDSTSPTMYFYYLPFSTMLDLPVFLKNSSISSVIFLNSCYWHTHTQLENVVIWFWWISTDTLPISILIPWKNVLESHNAFYPILSIQYFSPKCFARLNFFLIFCERLCLTSIRQNWEDAHFKKLSTVVFIIPLRA